MTERSIDSPLTRWQRILIVLPYTIAAVLAFLWAWMSGRPVQLAEIASGKVQCLSYSPPADTPIYLQPVTPEIIRRDLQHLKPYTNCVRTYSVDNGLQHVPAIARELGLEVMMGAWIGVDHEHNGFEIERLIGLANQYQDVVRVVIAGNEVLLRRDQPKDVLRSYIQLVRSRVSVPVTYADVWEFWLENRDVAEDVNFVTVHMLPYWEDHPIPVHDSVNHIVRVLGTVQHAFPQHPIFIGEAGWPSEGRQRAGAVPGRVNQAQFFREFTVAAEKHGFSYNFIEAFDQPWKRVSEGTVGGAWGLFDANGEIKTPLQGPVQEEHRWRVPLVTALAVALLAIGIGWARWGRAHRWSAMSFLGVAGYTAGVVLIMQAWMLVEANRNLREWIGSLFWAASGWVVVVCGALLLVHRLLGLTRTTRLVGAGTVFANVRVDGLPIERLQVWLAMARVVLMFCMSYMCLLLTLDPRYRDIPIAQVILPTFTLLVCAISTTPTRAHIDDHIAAEEIVLGCWLIIASVWIAIGEGLANTRALLWCLLCVLIGGSVLRSERPARQRERAEQQAEAGELNPV